MQEILVLLEQDLFMNFLEDDAPVAGVGLAVADNFEVAFWED